MADNEMNPIERLMRIAEEFGAKRKDLEQYNPDKLAEGEAEEYEKRRDHHGHRLNQESEGGWGE